MTITAAPLAVGFAGLSHLGLVSAAAAAARGARVVGYDPTPGLAARIAAGDLPVVEPDLPETIAVAGDRLRFSDAIDALAGCDLVFVARDVPTDDKGGSDLAPIRDLVAALDRALPPASLIIILAQVPPGFTRQLGLPAARLAYQVETLVFGRAVERALHPERVILGVADPAAPLPAAWAAFLALFGCPLLPMRLESAELAKTAINLCLAASVTVANTLAGLSERIGADWREIAPALRLDRRIGPAAYLDAGLGLAGGNLERDLATLTGLAAEAGSEASLIAAILASSRHRRDWALGALHEAVLSDRPAARLGLLGLAYKENTRSIKNSVAVRLLGQLPAAATVRAFDPAVPAGDLPDPARIVVAASAAAAVDGADALLILTPWPEFRDLDPADLAGRMVGRIVIDPYQMLDAGRCLAAGLQQITLGR